MNVLFICSRNQWRSPTGEAVWRKLDGVNVRSAGTSPNARKTVSAHDIRWADIIFVMEPKHQQRLQAEFRQLVSYKRIEVLDIPDDYKYMDPELVEIFETEAAQFLDQQDESLA
ncbi:low molecular weight protein tyrosine phosphatase family protein [Romeriopsis navalis]|nr:phosphotyrosine protein phosphatase [Romeriopsis navalis]